MNFHKFIVTSRCGSSESGNAYLLADNYDKSLASFLQLVIEARKDFDVNDARVECRIVLHSRWCKGCPVIRFSVPPHIVKEGWTNTDSYSSLDINVD
jgi:hypothetical protein